MTGRPRESRTLLCATFVESFSWPFANRRLCVRRGGDYRWRACCAMVYRPADGSGMGLQGINLLSCMQDRQLPQEAFPPYFLRSDGHDDRHRILVEEFFRWQAPWLLLLPDLQGAERRVLERHARPQALIVDKQFRLYPEIIDEALIKAARVEAMLRKGQQQEPSEEDIMSTFYIELHPSPTE